MKNLIFLSTCLIILTVSATIQAVANDNTKDTNKATKVHTQVTPKKQTQAVIEKKIDRLILQQKQHQELIMNLDKRIHKQESLQKKFQTDVSQQIKAVKQKMDHQWTLQTEQAKKNQELIRSQSVEIDQQLQSLQANIFSSVSESTQYYDKTIQSHRNDLESQMNEIHTLIQNIQLTMMSDQSNRYSAIERSRDNLNSKMASIVDQLSQFQNQLSEDKPDLQQILNEQVAAQQERFNTIETNIKNLVSNSNAQLNSDINETIRQLKSDFNRFKQEIDNAMSKISSQVLEIKHEQQIELQSLVKQLTKELNRHDQNISESLLKAEQNLNTIHLTWVIYGLICLIIGLIIFIIWDRNTTVAPLIARIRKLEDNLVIEY